MNFRKNKDAAELHKMLWAWREQAAKLESGEISKEEYDRWRYHYPEFDTSTIRAKMPSVDFTDLLMDELNKSK